MPNLDARAQEKWREWMRWLCAIGRAYPTLPDDTGKNLQKFVEEADKARVGGIIISYRHKEGPPKIVDRHVKEFAHDVANMLAEHIKNREEGKNATSALPAGASISRQWVNGFRCTAIDTGNPADTARTCADALINEFQTHLKRCPESAFPTCQGIYLAYKTSQIYCDDNCRQRAFEPTEKKESKHGQKKRKR